MTELLTSIEDTLNQYNDKDTVQSAMAVLRCNIHRLTTTPIEDILPVCVVFP